MSFQNKLGVSVHQHVLDNTSLVITANDLDLPFTVTLQSSAVGRKIEFSTNGINFFEAQYDTNDPAFLVVAVLAPISHIKVTGSVSDVLNLTE